MFLMFGLSLVFPWLFAGSWFFSVSVLLVQAKQSTRFLKDQRFLNCGDHKEKKTAKSFPNLVYAKSFPNLVYPTGVTISKDRWTFRKGEPNGITVEFPNLPASLFGALP